MLKSFFVGGILAMLVNVSGAIDLQGRAEVNVNSDTAANAKNMAFDQARRQIVMGQLRQYAEVEALQNAVYNAKSSELTKLIASSGIDGEQLSDTGYSATITMVVDAEAAKIWLDEKKVKNWLPDGDSQDTFVVTVTMSDPLGDWINLNQLARKENIDLGTKNLFGGSAILELPRSVRGKFTIVLRESGWGYANDNGNLRIWK